MALGLPDYPPEGRDFTEAVDEFCPSCHEFDSDTVRDDPQAAFNAGILLAVEKADGPLFSAMAASQSFAWYIHCPNCGQDFSVEEEQHLGAMS